MGWTSKLRPVYDKDKLDDFDWLVSLPYLGEVTANATSRLVAPEDTPKVFS